MSASLAIPSRGGKRTRRAKPEGGGVPAGAATLWRTHLLALGGAWLGLLVFFQRDAAHIVSIWWTSSTFNHCLLIVPLIAWLVWQRAPELAERRPAAWWPGLLGVGAGAFLWLLGEAGSLASARHLGLVVMLQGAVVALLGREVARGLIFPLFYAFFLVPFGEELVPAMQILTARLATALLGLAGVAAHLEGIFITTAAGYFEVAEACAGAKFLIAMAAFGALVANVAFRSWRRRLVFLAAALILPVLANGVRAAGTILVAHQRGIAFAESFDHVVYGGIFFALVIALLLGLAWRWFDRGLDEPWLAPSRATQPRAAPLAGLIAALVLLAALPLAWTGAVASAARSPDAAFELPAVRGWQRLPAAPEWRPRFAAPDLQRAARYRDARGRAVDMVLVLYARQDEGREIVGFGQGEVPRWTWLAGAAAPDSGRADRIASRRQARELVTFYRVGRLTTGSAMAVKLETMRRRLLGGPQHAGAVLVSAPDAQGVGRAAIGDFLAALGPPGSLVDRAAGAD